jgi:hypothetical protein
MKSVYNCISGGKVVHKVVAEDFEEAADKLEEKFGDLSFCVRLEKVK